MALGAYPDQSQCTNYQAKSEIAKKEYFKKIIDTIGAPGR